MWLEEEVDRKEWKVKGGEERDERKRIKIEGGKEKKKARMEEDETKTTDQKKQGKERGK